MRKFRTLLLVGGMAAVLIYFIAEYCQIHWKTSSQKFESSPTNKSLVEVLDDGSKTPSRQVLGYDALGSPAWRRPRRSTPPMKIFSAKLPVNSLVNEALETSGMPTSKPIVTYSRDNSHNLQQVLQNATTSGLHSPTIYAIFQSVIVTGATS